MIFLNHLYCNSVTYNTISTAGKMYSNKNYRVLYKDLTPKKFEKFRLDIISKNEKT